MGMGVSHAGKKNLPELKTELLESYLTMHDTVQWLRAAVKERPG